MRRMYSKKQLEELISQMSGDILEVKNVKQLNDEQCDGLKVGDVVAKKTGKQYHLYLVTYKQDKHGLCLSYFDASVVETQSYDYTNGHWVYNSEDKTALVNVEAAPTGEIQDVLGLDAENKLVKGAVSGGGLKLYKHSLVSKTASGDKCILISTSPTQANISDANVISVINISKTAVTRCCLTDFSLISSGFYVGYMTFTQSGTSYLIALGSHLSLEDSTKWDDTIEEL